MDVGYLLKQYHITALYYRPYEEIISDESDDNVMMSKTCQMENITDKTDRFNVSYRIEKERRKMNKYLI